MAEKQRVIPMPPIHDPEEQDIVGGPEGFNPPQPGEASKGPQPTATEKAGGPKARRVDPEGEKKVKERTLDKTLADSFPTSDPPSTIPDPSEDDSFAA
ncbi:MAG TPA: hypothetical protein VGQ71_15010 [Terriglobales bacterium]|jgi:hypothetical protein|nr:hypothetical protein [Terriglobales bacterium]